MKMTPFFLFGFLAAATVSGVETSRVVIDHASDMAEGEPVSVSIVEPGTLVAAPSWSVLADLKDRQIWSAVWSARSGGVVLGAGSEGSVELVGTGGGGARRLTKFGESDVQAVAVGPKGEIYAASTPKGKIFRRSAAGVFEEYFDPKADGIWALVCDANGVLYAATGSEGKIFRITGPKQGMVWFDADEPIIRTMVVDARGRIWAGTSGGKVYRIAANGSAVLVLSGAGEIRSLVAAPSGDVYVGLNGEGGRSAAPERPAAPRGPAAEGEDATKAGNGKPPAPPKPTSAPAPSGSKASFELHRIPDGATVSERVWQGRATIQSMAWYQDKVWMGTGDDGQIYTWDPENARAAQVVRVDARQVTGLVPTPAGLVAVTCNPGLVVRMEATPRGGAVYRSKVIDAGQAARWGNILVEGRGTWRVRTRSGNASDPDKSWHDWAEAPGGRPSSPEARYLQFELVLEAGAVERITVHYRQKNLAPVVSRVVVTPPGTAYVPLPQPPAPPSPVTADQLMRGGAGGPEGETRFQPQVRPGMRALVWQASDPNKDDLAFKVEIRADGASEWSVLKEETRERVFSWDTTGWPEGVYTAKVTATDRPTNMEGEARTGSALSEAWVIDHTAPVVDIRSTAGGWVQFTVSDRHDLLERVEVSVDGVEFTAVHPEDGVIDSGTESFRVKREAGKPFHIRAADRSGNVGGARLP
jgi:hypothetical protein